MINRGNNFSVKSRRSLIAFLICKRYDTYMPTTTFTTKIVMTTEQLLAETIADAEAYYGDKVAIWTAEYNRASEAHKENMARLHDIASAEDWVAELRGESRAKWQRMLERLTFDGATQDDLTQFMMERVRDLRDHRVNSK